MTKTPLVFVPGLMCDRRLFAAQVRALGGVRPVGHADLSKDATIAAMSERMLAEAADRFCLVGLSMGGIVAFEAWRRAPARIAGLALLNTTPFADSPARQATRLSQIDRVKRGQLRSVVMEELKPNYLGPRSKGDHALLDEIYAMAASLGPEVFIQQSRALMSRKDSVDTLSTINCPTIIIAGAEDDVCPPELHEIMHRGIEASKLLVVPGSGHLSTMEAPDLVSKALSEFLGELDHPK
jgi:pimeloyl-ACP methyl ester carboxylesterase